MTSPNSSIDEQERVGIMSQVQQAKIEYLEHLIEYHRKERSKHLHLIHAQALMIADLLEGTE
jgi:hypothetical protein